MVPQKTKRKTRRKVTPPPRELASVRELTADPANVRLHPDANLEAIRGSLLRFGQQKPIVVDARGIVVAGNGTLAAARVLGWDELWVVRTELEGVEAVAFGIADNRTAELAEWDQEALEKILGKLAQGHALNGVGFSEEEVARMFPGEPPPRPPLPELRGDVDAQVVHGDCIEELAKLEEGSIDAVVTDPPYGLEFMGKEWDTFRVDERSARWAGSEKIGGAGAGFGEIPGGAKLLSYGKRRTTSTCRTCGKRDALRNLHACDKEDKADWVTICVDKVPMEMRAFQAWSTAWACEVHRVLKPGGHLLSFGGTRMFHRMTCALEDAGFEIRDCLSWMYGSGFPKSLDVSKAIDKAAGAEREQVRHLRARNPKSIRGGEGIEGGDRPCLKKAREVGYHDMDGPAPVTDAARQWDGWGTALKPAWEPVILARKPLEGTVAENVQRYGTGALNVDGCRIGTEGGTESVGEPNRLDKVYGDGMGGLEIKAADHGRWPANVALDEEAAAALDEQSGESTSPESRSRSPDGPAKATWSLGREGGTQIGHGDSGGASRFFYTAKASTSERTEGGAVDNLHPTVKPVELMRWLVRLVTPPGGRVLDPFTGSGSTGVACQLEGFDFLGIEREAEHVKTAKERLGISG